MKNIGFDIDGTLWEIIKGADGKVHQVPDYGLIGVLRWFHANGDKIFAWSAGGIDHAETIIHKLGLDHMVTVISKGMYDDEKSGIKMDLCFDDEEVNLASCNIRVSRQTIEL